MPQLTALKVKAGTENLRLSSEHVANSREQSNRSPLKKKGTSSSGAAMII
jgi:hypothetical protein